MPRQEASRTGVFLDDSVFLARDRPRVTPGKLLAQFFVVVVVVLFSIRNGASMTILAHNIGVQGILFVLSYVYDPCCVTGMYVIAPTYSYWQCTGVLSFL